MPLIMSRAAACVGAAALLACSASASDGPQPGLWKVTTKPEINAMMAPEQVKTRCLTAEEVRDVEKTFVPEHASQGASCHRVDVQWTGQKLTWRIQCVGALAMDVAGAFDFDNPQHYTGVITTSAAIGGQEMRSRTTLEGQWIGACPN